MSDSPFLALTQLSGNTPDLFVDLSRNPLPVYLDVNSEIISRPKFIRLLRNSGANICHSPAAASILLVNPDAEFGRKIVHDWHRDSHKVVLSYLWIQACLEDGQALLEEDDWGGHRILHTSGCIYSEEEDDEDAADDRNGYDGETPSPMRKSVPTGRTASRPLLSKGKQAARLSLKASPVATSSAKPISKILPSKFTSSRSAASKSRFVQPAAHQPGPSAATPSSSTPIPAPNLPVPPLHRDANSVPGQQVFPNPGSHQQSSVVQTLPSFTASLPAPDFSQLFSTQFQAPGPLALQSLPPALNFSGLQQSPANPLQYMQALSSAYQFHNAASQTLTQLVETVIAVAQRQGIDTVAIQNCLAALPMPLPSSQPMAQSSQIQNPVQLPPSSPVEQHPPSSPQPSTSPHSRSRPSIQKGASRSVAEPETRSSTVATPSATAKRKRLASGPSQPGPQSKKLSSRDFPSRTEPVGTKHGGAKSPGGVFCTRSGRPMLIFVQVDVRGRSDLVASIKKNGGKMSPNIPKVEFAVLNPNSLSYPSLRQEAISSGRPIVQPAFIMESARQGRLLDPKGYLIEDSRSQKKRGRPSTSFFGGRFSGESEHDQSDAQASDTAVEPEPPSPLSPIAPSPPALSHIAPARRARSLTPEPPAPVQSKRGYKFTPAEMTYVWTVYRRLLAKDPSTSKSTLAQTLHNKMPHRSETTWSAILSKHKEMLDAVKAESQLGRRSRRNFSDREMDDAGRGTEELEELQVGAALEPDEDELMQDDEQHSPLAEVVKMEDDSAAYSQDFEALVQFLTSPASDIGGEEDELFSSLARKTKCVSAPSWSDFLEEHGDAVSQEVERRIALAASSASS
ncbi:hypothetical protein BC834DRAFT_16393 [Gloeopeniophorella convolvens]|nr:hypothetical protein BC834DRAFT_16393 [Gloeopeniophorella convolvens]